MMSLGLTCRWYHTCQSVGDCSFPSASAAPWSSPPVGCSQSADACSPGMLWRGSYTPGYSLQQGNLQERGHNTSQVLNDPEDTALRTRLWTCRYKAQSCMCCSYHQRKVDFLWLQENGDWRGQGLCHHRLRRQSSVLVWRPAPQCATGRHSELNLRSNTLYCR